VTLKVKVGDPPAGRGYRRESLASHLPPPGWREGGGWREVRPPPWARGRRGGSRGDEGVVRKLCDSGELVRLALSSSGVPVLFLDVCQS